MRLGIEKGDIPKTTPLSIFYQTFLRCPITDEHEVYTGMVRYLLRCIQCGGQSLRKSMRTRVENGKPVIPAKLSAGLRFWQRKKPGGINPICQQKNSFWGKPPLDERITNPLCQRPDRPGSPVGRPFQPLGKPNQHAVAQHT